MDALARLEQDARDYFVELQGRICTALEALEPRARFGADAWAGGTTRVLSGGQVLEKAGVSLADVEGTLSARIAARLDAAVQPFRATGLSLVLHPLSPRVPAVHMNVRLVRLLGPDAGPGAPAAPRPRDGSAWFGGGTDLTPHYLVEEDAAHFHAVLRAACERHEPGRHARYKQACDEYFRLPHRDEVRGVGGIFFDYLREPSLARAFDFVRDVGDAFLPAWLPIAERRRAEPWWERERQWQLLRRGRYVEFNLLHDRGTLFGLETGGRTESILMSLPPLVRWTYDQRPEPGSPEAALLEVLRHPRAW